MPPTPKVRFLTGFLTATFFFAPFIYADTYPPYRAKVIQVLDGKTIRVSTGHRVELQGLKMIPGKEAKAKKVLNELVFHKEVVLNYDPKEPDRYGRAYAYVFQENVFINRVLIEKGVAEIGRIPESFYYKSRLLGELEEEPAFEEEIELSRDINKRMTAQFFYIWGSLVAAVLLAFALRMVLRNK